MVSVASNDSTSGVSSGGSLPLQSPFQGSESLNNGRVYTTDCLLPAISKTIAASKELTQPGSQPFVSSPSYEFRAALIATPPDPRIPRPSIPTPPSILSSSASPFDGAKKTERVSFAEAAAVNVPDDGNCVFYSFAAAVKLKYAPSEIEKHPEVQNLKVLMESTKPDTPERQVAKANYEKKVAEVASKYEEIQKKLDWNCNPRQLKGDLGGEISFFSGVGSHLRAQAASWLEGHIDDDNTKLAIFGAILDHNQVVEKNINETTEVLPIIQKDINTLEAHLKESMGPFIQISEKYEQLYSKKAKMRDFVKEEGLKNYINQSMDKAATVLAAIQKDIDILEAHLKRNPEDMDVVLEVSKKYEQLRLKRVEIETEIGTFVKEGEVRKYINESMKDLVNIQKDISILEARLGRPPEDVDLLKQVSEKYEHLRSKRAEIEVQKKDLVSEGGVEDYINKSKRDKFYGGSAQIYALSAIFGIPITVTFEAGTSRAKDDTFNPIHSELPPIRLLHVNGNHFQSAVD